MDTEHQLDTISKKFNDIHNLEIKRREIMLKKIKARSVLNHLKHLEINYLARIVITSLMAKI